jgi:hypothetical protein
MKTSNLKKIVIAGVALAGLAFIQNVRADVEVLFVGGTASESVLWDRATNYLNGTSPSLTVTISPTNTNVRTFVGSVSGQAGLGKVTLDYSLLGAVQALQDLTNLKNEVTALTNSTITPTLAVSSTTPEAVALSSSPFHEEKTLIAPYVFVKNPSTSPGLANVTNLTQRQAYYLENSANAGFHSAYLGGTNTTDSVYFVGRNTASAVRTEIDANIYFTGSLSTWTTNASGAIIFDGSGGQSSGSLIRSVLTGLKTNAIGTVAVQDDISPVTALNYEGIPYSVTNVENGSYPLWGYEHWYWQNSGSGAPSQNQPTVIAALLNSETNATYQTTSPVFTADFVPYSGMQVERTQDGGPITAIP